MKCVLHVHSRFSDGDLTLAQLRDIYLGLTCRVVCMTDHAEAFSAETLQAYVSECETRSDDRLRFIAGLEFSCRNGMHVLGFGATVRVASKDPQIVIAHIRDAGGVAVIAHPKLTAFDWIETFEDLPHGIEIWNAKYDGQYAPRTATVELLRRLRVRDPAVHAFYGQDMHLATQPRRLFTVVESAMPTRGGVLGALAEGRYRGINGRLSLPSDGGIPARTMARFDRAHTVVGGIRRIGRAAKRLGERFGVPIPPQLTATARRLL